MSSEWEPAGGHITIKQGGVLSPTVFSVYMDDLFERLQKRGVGCYMGNYFVGCLAYADDLTILAPSKKALQIMINICQGYAADHDVILYGPKSQFIVFRGRECKADNCYVMVNGNQLNNTSSAIHLGHRISSDDNECAISASVAQFWKAFNILRADFGTLYPYLQCKLFKQYCCSFYGAPLWSFNSYHKICVPWRKALRKIWNVSYMTHCKIVAMLSECIPLELGLQMRFCKFVNSIVSKGSSLVKHIAAIARQNPFSVYGNNCNEIINKYGANFSLCKHGIVNEWNMSVNEKSNVNVIKEMINIRDGRSVCENLTREEVLYVIDDICLN